MVSPYWPLVISSHPLKFLIGVLLCLFISTEEFLLAVHNPFQSQFMNLWFQDTGVDCGFTVLLICKNSDPNASLSQDHSSKYQPWWNLGTHLSKGLDSLRNRYYFCCFEDYITVIPVYFSDVMPDSLLDLVLPAKYNFSFQDTTFLCKGRQNNSGVNSIGETVRFYSFPLKKMCLKYYLIHSDLTWGNWKAGSRRTISFFGGSLWKIWRHWWLETNLWVKLIFDHNSNACINVCFMFTLLFEYTEQIQGWPRGGTGGSREGTKTNPLALEMFFINVEIARNCLTVLKQTFHPCGGQ